MKTSFLGKCLFLHTIGKFWTLSPMESYSMSSTSVLMGPHLPRIVNRVLSDFKMTQKFV